MRYSLSGAVAVWLLGFMFCCGGSNDDTCQPECSGKECGDDGCGGSCGECDANETCTEDGTCACWGLCGSECDLISCDFDKIICQLYQDPLPHAIVVHYKRVVTGGERWAAKIMIDLEGIDTVEGIRIEGADFLDRIGLSIPGEDEQWPDSEGHYCEITQGGDVPETDMTGICSFAFVDGRLLEADFSCLLEDVLP